MTPEILAEVARLLPTVVHLKVVADFIGVDRVTIYRWVKRGARESKRLLKPKVKARPKETIYAEFCNAVKKAVAQAETNVLGIIVRAAVGGRPLVTKKTTRPDGTVIEEIRHDRGEWTAAAWLGERIASERWGRDTHQIAELKALIAEQGKQLDVIRDQLPPPETPTPPKGARRPRRQPPAQSTEAPAPG